MIFKWRFRMYCSTYYNVGRDLDWQGFYSYFCTLECTEQSGTNVG